MGFISHRVKRSDIKAGDHLYTWRALFIYSHHGIFVGGDRVVHFTPGAGGMNATTSFSSSANSALTCPNLCGLKHPNSGVILSCLDCFLGSRGSLYLYQYGVSTGPFLAKVRAGTCTTVQSDPPQEVIHRAMHLLRNGFGDYDMLEKNCEDFALYCKTGLLVRRINRSDLGSSGQKAQASSIMGAPLAALLPSPLKLLMPASPLGMATVAAAGMYYMCRYGADIGVRTDVIKVAVEDLVANHGLVEVPGEKEASEGVTSTQMVTI